jgi:DNA-binding transcriptional LysR family regulator
VPTPAGSPSQIPQCIDIRQAAEYEFLLSDYDTILGREARRIFREHDLTPISHNEKLSAFFAAAMGAAGLGLAFTYYSSRHYYRNASFLSLGEDGVFLELGLAMPPGRYHSRAALALRDVMIRVLEENPSAGSRAEKNGTEKSRAEKNGTEKNEAEKRGAER